MQPLLEIEQAALTTARLQKGRALAMHPKCCPSTKSRSDAFRPLQSTLIAYTPPPPARLSCRLARGIRQEHRTVVRLPREKFLQKCAAVFDSHNCDKAAKLAEWRAWQPCHNRGRQSTCVCTLSILAPSVLKSKVSATAVLWQTLWPLDPDTMSNRKTAHGCSSRESNVYDDRRVKEELVDAMRWEAAPSKPRAWPRVHLAHANKRFAMMPHSHLFSVDDRPIWQHFHASCSRLLDHVWNAQTPSCLAARPLFVSHAAAAGPYCP